ncbi:MAG: hypothetical protein K8R69_04425, partial [Deltaproteobacteria bacterium]|nr:hypothetical protein [Deltaproteobacteria bacterium]
MQSTSLNKSSSIHPIQREETSDRHASKSLRQNQGTDPKQKLVNWYEQAYAYYGAVISGAESKPDSKAWQGFLDQMEWASDQLGYAGPQATNLELGGFPQGSDDSSGFPQQEVPNGASVGPMGTLVWNSPTADITDVGGHETHDIWSNEVHLAVASVGATVTSEITTDTRLSPPEQVLKIVVKDK